MHSPTKKRNYLTAALSMSLLLLLGLAFYSWKELQSSQEALQIAQEKIASDSSTLLSYQLMNEEIDKTFLAYDSSYSATIQQPALTKLTSLLQKLTTDNVLLKEIAKGESTKSSAQQKKIASLEYELLSKQKNIATYESQVAASEQQHMLQDMQTERLKERLSTLTAEADSLANALAILQDDSQKRQPDSLKILSPKGNEIFYYGATQDAQPAGFGIGFYKGLGYYIGEWKGNARHGQGKHHYKDGSIYEGNFQNDAREGYGTYYYNTNQVYKGQWKADLMNGAGEIIDANGKKVKGIWENGKMNAKE